MQARTRTRTGTTSPSDPVNRWEKVLLILIKTAEVRDIVQKIVAILVAEIFKIMIASAGGLLAIVPMLIIVLDPHRTKVSILIVISFSIFILIGVLGFIGLVTEIIRIWFLSLLPRAMDIKDRLAIVTAYAAVLMVSVGGYVSGGTDSGTES